MLNEEKIILMTQMASYEENEGKKEHGGSWHTIPGFQYLVSAM